MVYRQLIAKPNAGFLLFKFLVNPSPTEQEASEQQAHEETPSQSLLPAEPDPSMQEYYELQWALLSWTGVFIGIIFSGVCFFYGLNLALNYLLGACTGVVYLRMLARDVEQLGRSKKRLGSGARLALFVGLIIVATQWNQLQVIPVFLGFLTYKVAIIAYVVWSTYLADPSP